MINIMLEGYDMGADWLRGELSRYVKPGDKVVVIAFSFRDSRVRDAQDWDRLYSRENGMYYGGIAGGFMDYGVREDDIRFINYFTDSHDDARRAVEAADIVYFPGGLPDRMMERIEEFSLTEALRAFDGVVMGYSAGAVIQLGEYHISPDDDYPEFGYYNGLGLVDGFYIEVHYEGNGVQDAAIRRVLKERGQRVYATYEGRGALIIENGKIRTLGKTDIFKPKA